MVNTVRLGVSSPELIAAEGLSWVLRRQTIICHAWPRMNDGVDIITAPTGFERGLLTYRDFHLRRPGGEILISAVSEWLLMDVHTRKLRPIPERVARLRHSLAPAASHLPRPESKLRAPDDVAGHFETEVRYGMLDFNDHLTNPVFAELLLEALGADFLRGHLPRTLDLVYKAEARYGERLRATVSGEARGRRHALYRGEEVLALMHSTWQSLHS